MSGGSKAVFGSLFMCPRPRQTFDPRRITELQSSYVDTRIKHRRAELTAQAATRVCFVGINLKPLTYLDTGASLAMILNGRIMLAWRKRTGTEYESFVGVVVKRRRSLCVVSDSRARNHNQCIWNPRCHWYDRSEPRRSWQSGGSGGAATAVAGPNRDNSNSATANGGAGGNGGTGALGGSGGVEVSATAVGWTSISSGVDNTSVTARVVMAERVGTAAQHPEQQAETAALRPR